MFTLKTESTKEHWVHKVSIPYETWNNFWLTADVGAIYSQGKDDLARNVATGIGLGWGVSCGIKKEVWKVIQSTTGTLWGPGAKALLRSW